MKKCINCFEVKSSGEFYKRIKGTPKLQSWCKKCNPEIQNGYRMQKKYKGNYAGTKRSQYDEKN